MLKDELKQYAVYKSNGTPWTQEQYELISYLMGDKEIIPRVTSIILKEKYIYLNDIKQSFPFKRQNIDGKTLIELYDFLALVDYKQLAFFKKDQSYWTFDELLEIEKLTSLKRGGPECEHAPTSNAYVYYPTVMSEFYCWSNQTAKSIETCIEFPYHLLETLVQMKMPKNSCNEICPDDSLRPLGLGISALHHGLRLRGLPLAGFSIPVVQQKTVAIDSLIKFLGEETMTNKNKISASAHLLAMAKSMSSGFEFGIGSYPKGKYLSLSIKNGQSNVKSLIHQAVYTGIKDPRPYIKDLIQRELNILTHDVSTINLENIDYGFNIKLASQVAYFKGLKAALAKNEITSMDTQDATNFYNFKKELVSYEKARTANENVCPYSWISNHLKSEVLDRPGLHELFVSNNIIITTKDGKLSFVSTKEGKKYSVNIKLNVATGLYSI